MNLTKSVSDVLTCTRVHVDAGATQGAFACATQGASEGARQTGHPAWHPGGHPTRQAKLRKCAKRLAPAAPPAG